MDMKKPFELRVKPIRNGTVIDHITANRSLNVLNILGLPDGHSKVTVAMNMDSSQLGSKDIVKIENRELKPSEVDQIALIAPRATINIVRDYKIVEKAKVRLMDEVRGILRCPNPNCITNSDEGVENRFYVISEEPVLLRCYYCERLIEAEEIESQF